MSTTTTPGRRIDVLGCPFDAIAFDQVVDRIRTAVRDDEWLTVVPGNVDFVMKARADESFRQRLTRADLVVADGVPITWAASMLGTPLEGRVSGTELVLACADVSAESGRPMALIGGAPGVAETAAREMRRLSPGAEVVAIDTPFPLTDEASEQICEQIRQLDAGIVLVALGAPRQERWVQEFGPRTGANVGIGVGSAFDIISGEQPRAPRVMRDNGFEWLHRLRLDPGRLARRYLIEDSGFLPLLAAGVARRRFGRTK